MTQQFYVYTQKNWKHTFIKTKLYSSSSNNIASLNVISLTLMGKIHSQPGPVCSLHGLHALRGFPPTPQRFAVGWPGTGWAGASPHPSAHAPCSGRASSPGCAPTWAAGTGSSHPQPSAGVSVGKQWSCFCLSSWNICTAHIQGDVQYWKCLGSYKFADSPVTRNMP